MLNDTSINRFVQFCFIQMSDIEQQRTASLAAHSAQSFSARRKKVTVADSYLTPREADCVRCILSGMKYKQVGEKLGLSHRTVEFYVKNIMEKFGIRNKKALIAYFSQHLAD